MPSFKDNIDKANILCSIFKLVSNNFPSLFFALFTRLSRQFINANDIIVIEDLNVKKMVQSDSTGLNKSISDAAWTLFRFALTYRAARAGRRVISVNPRVHITGLLWLRVSRQETTEGALASLSHVWLKPRQGYECGHQYFEIGTTISSCRVSLEAPPPPALAGGVITVTVNPMRKIIVLFAQRCLIFIRSFKDSCYLCI